MLLLLIEYQYGLWYNHILILMYVLENLYKNNIYNIHWLHWTMVTSVDYCSKYTISIIAEVFLERLILPYFTYYNVKSIPKWLFILLILKVVWSKHNYLSCLIKIPRRQFYCYFINSFANISSWSGWRDCLTKAARFSCKI